LEAFHRQPGPWPTEALALRPGPPKARHYPFSDALAFKLGQGCQDVKLQLSGWRRAVDSFTEADERTPSV